jgi:serine/threonine-protein kinase
VKQIGRYRILEKLGHGGMGVVYKAFDPQIERNVAIKVISTQRVDDPELRDRFFREARAAGLLSHPNIVVVYDLGEHEAQPYIAMEFVDGVTLDAVMRSGEPFPMSRRIGLMLDVCEGLGYAHDRGVIHRDVKPGNIMVSRAGSAKILDFGLARLVSSDLTRSNLMLGTMSYMAPEQLRSEAIDHRIDIFAIGVVMYELFSGRRPFQSDSAASAIYNVLEEEPVPVHECNPHAPPELGPIVGRALAKDREQRYSSMHELAQDLASIPVTPEQDAPVPVSPLPGTASEFEPTMLPHTLLPAASRRTTPTPRARTPARGTRTPSGRAPGSAPPVPTPHAGPPGAATPSSADGARHRPSALGKGTWLAIAAAVVLVAAVAAGILLRPTEGTQPSGDRATATRVDTAADQQRARSHVARGREAFRAADYKTALDEAEAALRVLPDDREGRRLLEEVRRVRSTIDSGTREARRLSEAGRYEEAARAASQVLALAPNDADAQAVLKQASSHAGREMASDAMRQLTRARAQADTDAARQHAREAFAAAQRAEAQARRRYEAGDFAAATNGFYETSSLYRAAAAEARRQVQLKESREEEAARARELEQRLTSARDAFDRRRAEAQEVGAPQRAVALFNSAQEQAARAAELGRDETAVREYEVAERRMDEARRLAIDAAARERAAAVAAAPPPVERPAPAAAPTATAPPRVDPNPEEAIQNVLRQYAAALESRNLEALKRIWPSLRGEQEQAIRDDFQNARDISVSIESPRIQAQQDAATVTCVRRYQLHTRDGRRQQAETQTTINMRLSGSSWIIDTIRHEQR